MLMAKLANYTGLSSCQIMSTLFSLPSLPRIGRFQFHLILQRIKSESAHRVNRLLGRCGHVWQDESFGHVLRHTETIAAKLEYLMGNPVAAGLVKNPLDYPWLWREFGNNAG
jgi:hypothetical protein